MDQSKYNNDKTVLHSSQITHLETKNTCLGATQQTKASNLKTKRVWMESQEVKSIAESTCDCLLASAEETWKIGMTLKEQKLHVHKYIFVNFCAGNTDERNK